MSEPTKTKADHNAARFDRALALFNALDKLARHGSIMEIARAFEREENAGRAAALEEVIAICRLKAEVLHPQVRGGHLDCIAVLELAREAHLVVNYR